MNPLFQSITFLTGAHTLAQAPPDENLEIAFAGRSNAGKSRAINAITGLNSLARVSKTPGRTQQMNFFALDATRRIVDLPGYGYAKVPEQMRRHWIYTLERYLQTRESLRGLILVMDVRHPLMPFDQQMLDWCVESHMPAHILLTKADKLSKGPGSAVREKVGRVLRERYHESAETSGEAEKPDQSSPSVQLFSALTRLGTEEAGQRIASWLTIADLSTDSAG